MVCEYNAYTEEGSQEVALFAYLGKFSHSCRPNCFRFHEDGNVVVRTLVPVDPGEELTVDYDSIRSQTMPIGVRREYLLRSKGFECLCPRCSAPADDTRSFHCCSNSPSSRSSCSGAHQASTLVPNLFTLTSCNLCGLVPTLLQTQAVLSAETLLTQQVTFLNEQAQNGGEVYEINALIDQMKSPHPHHFYASEYWAIKGRQAQEFNDMKEVTRCARARLECVKAILQFPSPDTASLQLRLGECLMNMAPNRAVLKEAQEVYRAAVVSFGITHGDSHEYSLDVSKSLASVQAKLKWKEDVMLSLQECSFCGCSNSSADPDVVLTECGKCHGVSYCCVQHQLAQEPIHKKNCKIPSGV
ncbi:hypothetical protein BDR26DRAFT_853942 [Obelidium mucronatum]|nr:hypothetical protein BDR26DRAFT_853942 [Obelidium mucronatum]